MAPLLNIPVILVYQSLANKFYLENGLLIISGNLGSCTQNDFKACILHNEVHNITLLKIRTSKTDFTATQIKHKLHFSVCCLFTCSMYWSCSYHVTKAELNIQTSNTQSNGKRPRQLLGEVQYKGAKTSGKQTRRVLPCRHKSHTKTIAEYPNSEIFNRGMECCPIKCTPFCPKGKKAPFSGH
jgi:hypothetical protein